MHENTQAASCAAPLAPLYNRKPPVSFNNRQLLECLYQAGGGVLGYFLLQRPSLGSTRVSESKNRANKA